MSTIVLSGREFTVDGGESALECLLRHGVPVPHSCKAGVCQSCLMRARETTPPARAQAGLKDTLRAQGYFLPCVCYPTDRLVIEPVGADAQTSAIIASVSPLSDSVVRIRLATENRLDYRAGQFVTLLREDGLARSYSLASLPAEGSLELHVRKVPGGTMSSWLHDHVSYDTPVRVQGPAGQCFYVPGEPDRALLLAGTGTGLAPLYGIARDALSHGHRGPIRLFHGALDPGGLYLVDELRAMARRHSNLEYVPVVLDASRSSGHVLPDVGSVDAVVLSRCTDVRGWKAYLCGDPGIVQTLRKKLFLAGVASKDIYADAFLPSAAPKATITSPEAACN